MQADILEITGKPDPRQSLDVLEKKGSWVNLADRAHGFGKHIPMIAMTTMLSSKGKRLTGWTARNEIDSVLERSEIKLPDISFDQRPRTHRLHAANLIFTQGIAAITIPLDHGDCLETRVTHPHAEATRAREKLDGLDFIHLPKSS